jgi:hypothetical protein
VTTGYSGKPLADKLGIKPGMVVHAVNAPEDYAEMLAWLPPGASVLWHADADGFVKAVSKQGGTAQFVHCFVASRAELEAIARRMALGLDSGGTLWVSWPKLSAAKRLGLAGDISEDTLRELLLPHGIVDVKVCAVSDIWSGLKFMWRAK